MKERYQHDKDFPKWLKRLGAWRINRESIDFNWGYFAPRFGFDFRLHKGGYFDERWAITFHLIWGCFYIHLPFKTGIDSCSPPDYGITIHNNTLWIYTGGKMDPEWNQCNQKWITWDLPWFTWDFEFHHSKDPNGNWVDGNYENRENFYKETHDYTYSLNCGRVQERTATIWETERQWHRKWFPWIKNNIRSIEVEFNDEVGEETGSWKGGCVGCGYEMLPNETMLQTLQRMEKERKF